MEEVDDLTGAARSCAVRGSPSLRPGLDEGMRCWLREVRGGREGGMQGVDIVSTPWPRRAPPSPLLFGVLKMKAMGTCRGLRRARECSRYSTTWRSEGSSLFGIGKMAKNALHEVFDAVQHGRGSETVLAHS